MTIVQLTLTVPDPVIHTIEIVGIGPRGPDGEAGPTGPGLPTGTNVTRVGNYIEFDFNGNTYHQRLLSGPAPLA
jgi:hypothetical protein